MCDAPEWLPELFELATFDGEWRQYVDAAYGVFNKDFFASRPKFRGFDVACRRDPIHDGKEAGFWHCVSEGRDEAARTPDLRRIERIRWVRAVLEHSDDPAVDVWQNERNGDRRCLIWFREEYLIVLGERQRRTDGRKYWQLITAYCTPEGHRKVSLRRERDGAKNG